MTTLVLQNYAQGCIVSYFYKISRVLSLSPEWLLNFLSNFYFPPCVRKTFKSTVLENALIRGIFTYAPPHSKLTPKFLPSSFTQSAFFRKSVFPTAEMGRGNYDLLYQNPVKKYEDDLEH